MTLSYSYIYKPQEISNILTAHVLYNKSACRHYLTTLKKVSDNDNGNSEGNNSANNDDNENDMSYLIDLE